MGMVSYAERQNSTMRRGMRRFTRLTNAFPRKVENLSYAVSLLYVLHFCSDSSKPTDNTSDGSRDYGSVVSSEDIAGLID
jgi:hypothetical protein